MEKILITGGGGFLGSYWAKRIADKFDVHITVNKSDFNLENIKKHKVDLTNTDEVSGLILELRPYAIIHCAAMANVDLCETEVEKAFLINAEASGVIAKLAKKINSRFLHISTDQIYDGKLEMYDENSIPNPVNNYGKSKLKGEELVLSNHPEAIILRTNFFGKGDKASFFDWAFQSLQMKTPINVFTNIEYTPIFIEDLIDAGMKLLMKNAKGVYNAVGSERISKSGFVRKVAKVFDLDDSNATDRIYDQSVNSVQRPLRMNLNNEKLRQVSGVRLHSIDESLQIIKQQMGI